MDENLPGDDLLMRYLDNEMDPDERDRFEFIMERDPSLMKKVESLRLTLEALKQAGTKEKVSRIHQEMMAEMTTSQKRAPVRRLTRTVLSVAASIVIFIAAAAGWWFYQLSSEDVYRQHYTSYMVSASRGNDSSKTNFSDLFQRGDFEGMIRASKTTRLTEQDSLLVALSYLQKDQQQPAIVWLGSLQKSSGVYQEDAEYYLAMAYLKNKQFEEAYQLLEKIKEDHDHLYNSQISDQLLWKVRLLRWK
jgi:hypothetical protein